MSNFGNFLNERLVTSIMTPSLPVLKYIRYTIEIDFKGT